MNAAKWLALKFSGSIDSPLSIANSWPGPETEIVISLLACGTTTPLLSTT